MEIVKRVLRFIENQTEKMVVDEETPLLMRDVGKTNEKKSDESSSLSVLQALTKSLDMLQEFYKALFANTTCMDKLILICGVLFAFLHGIAFPFVAVLFGSLTNTYIQQAINGYANKSSTSYGTIGLYNYTKDLLNVTDDQTPILLPNSTELGLPEQMVEILNLINETVLKTFTEQQALTKDQFINYTHITGLLFCVLAALIFICSFLQTLCWESVSVNQLYNLRKSVISQVLKQNMSWFNHHDTSEIVSDIFSEVEHVRSGIGFKFGNIVEYFSMFTAAAAIAILTSWRLALVFLIPTPFILFRILSFGKMVAEKSKEYTKKHHEVEKIATEVLETLDTVVACCEQQNEINRYDKTLEDSMRKSIKQYNAASLGNAFLTVIVYGAYASAFWYSCRLLMQQLISPGEIYTIFLSITMATIALKNIISMIPAISYAYASAKHLEEYTAVSSMIDSAVSSRQADGLNGDIEFKNVSFAYHQDGKQILKNLSFKIQAGKTVAIVSEAGEGKTTIANLLLRLYDPTNIDGEITIDNINIKHLSLESLRKQLGISFQNLFTNNEDEALNEVIRAGRGNINDSDIQSITKIVRSFQEYGVGPPVTKITKFTSKNILRKVDLARALITQPSILILDESFNELDLFNEEGNEIRRKILDYRKGKTTIILSNHFLQVEHVDRIYLLKDGEILEKNIGTHTELMERQNSLYALMINAEIIFEKLKHQMIKEPIGYGAAGGGLTLRTGLKKPKKKQATIWTLIFNSIRPKTKKFWKIGLIGCFITGLQTAIFSFYFVEIFGTFSKTGPRLADEGVFWAGMLIILALIAVVGIWLKNSCICSAGLYLLSELRKTTFSSVLRRPKCYFQQKKITPNALWSTMMRNAPFIKYALEFHVPEGLSIIVTQFCIGIIITLLVWQIGLIAILGVAPILICLAITLFKCKANGRRLIADADDKASKIICPALEKIILTQVYCMRKKYLDKYDENAKKGKAESKKQILIFSTIYACCEALFFIFCGSSFLYGAYLIQLDAIEPQSLFKIFFSTAFTVLLFSQIVSFMYDLAEAFISLEQINDLINDSSEGENEGLDALSDKGKSLDHKYIEEGNIEFEEVYFGYRKQCDILDNFNLIIPAGSTVGLTGKSPFCGSTILYLIQRFYDVRGRLNLSGNKEKDSIRSYKLAHLRQHIGWVQQNITFMDGSLGEIIKYGCKNKDKISNEQVLEIVGQVKLLDEFGSELLKPRDKNYWNNLSQGKKVLIAIARAISHNPKILLVDSPTDFLSSAEEEIVLDVLKEVKKNWTCVIVSTIPSTLSYLADKIVVIENGQVVEQGSKDKLLADDDGYFANCVKMFKKTM